MMFIKRQLAIVVMMVMGFLGLSGYFINWQTLRDFTEKDATNFYMIIANNFLIKVNVFFLSLIGSELKILVIKRVNSSFWELPSKYLQKNDFQAL